MAGPEMACVYASLILHDDSVDISAENISTLLKAANVSVDAYWPGLFAKVLEKNSIEDLISSIGSGDTFHRIMAHIGNIEMKQL